MATSENFRPAFLKQGDPGWFNVYDELEALHIEKSSSYGSGEDALDNFVQVAEASGNVEEQYVYERILEKTVRALNLIRAGRADEVKEGPDIGSLALCAEALRRRRLT